MKIDTIPEHLLSEVDESQIADLLARCFETDFAGRSYFYQRHHLRIVARDPEIVGHVAVLFRAIRQGPNQMTIAGLAEVATSPDRRGQGIARVLVKQAIETVQNTIAKHLLLFGDAPLYGALGFNPVANHLRFLMMDNTGNSSLAEGPSNELMVLELGKQAWDDETQIDLLGRKF